ncbi:hypothetical protein [Nitrosospira sp. NRS527]|uniref:hypothetical protein n=1 Tax=Nitrosospira sp. NRS527 TaxID=155925 RepID=UPI001BD1239E|nr:hypothetical protein [Nitrosospira sp. NRS527]
MLSLTWHAQQPAQARDWVDFNQTAHQRKLENGRKVSLHVDGRPRAMGLAFFQPRANLLDTNIAHWHPIELWRQVLPDAGFLRAVGTERYG